jgi:diaminopimelate decarboxylase
MASTYNARPLVPEVLVNGDSYAVVRKRQSYEALLALDSFAEWQDDRTVDRRRTG